MPLEGTVTVKFNYAFTEHTDHDLCFCVHSLVNSLPAITGCLATAWPGTDNETEKNGTALWTVSRGITLWAWSFDTHKWINFVNVVHHLTQGPWLPPSASSLARRLSTVQATDVVLSAFASSPPYCSSVRQYSSLAGFGPSCGESSSLKVWYLKFNKSLTFFRWHHRFSALWWKAWHSHHKFVLKEYFSGELTSAYF